jgi:hypothetical protein
MSDRKLNSFGLRLLMLMLAAVFGAAAPAWAGTQPGKVWRFDVYVNDKPVGQHEYRLQQQGEQQWLTSEASFEYKLLYLTLYRYQHQNQEVWQDGCLARIESSTDANGKDYAVFGEAGANGFMLESSKGEAVLPGCVHTFAYWNPQFLQASRLLNTQNGEYLEVAVSEPIEDTIEVMGRQVPAQRYQLTAKKLTLDLWYSPDGEWLGLKSVYDNGRELRYELASPPASVAMAGGGQ